MGVIPKEDSKPLQKTRRNGAFDTASLESYA